MTSAMLFALEELQRFVFVVYRLPNTTWCAYHSCHMRYTLCRLLSLGKHGEQQPRKPGPSQITCLG